MYNSFVHPIYRISALTNIRTVWQGVKLSIIKFQFASTSLDAIIGSLLTSKYHIKHIGL